MAAELHLSRCVDEDRWDQLVSASPQGTIFSQARFLRSLGNRYTLWLVEEGANTVAKTVALVAAVEKENADGSLDLVRFPFTPYQGLLFLHDAKTLARQRVLDEFRIGEFVIAALAPHYRQIEMSLSWLVTDVRPFLWHNYHQAELGQFRLAPRYTALLDLQTVSEDEIKMQARACRRQEFKKAASYELNSSTDVEQFISIYAQTFARQEIALDDGTLALVERITRAALAGGFGELTYCATSAGIASMNLFLFDAQRAYYLLAANEPSLRNSGAATRLMFENIFSAKRRGLQELDFVGVNSPNRGDFKLSFNPALALYFDATLSTPT